MDTLKSIAEVAITMAGFSALISLLQKGKSEWKFDDTINLIRFYVMAEISIMIMIYCYLPIIISGFEGVQQSFKFSSYITTILTVIYFYFSSNRNKRYTGKTNVLGIHTIMVRLYGVALILFNLLIALGVTGDNYEGSYLTFIFLTLLMPIYFFLRLLYFTISKPS